MALLVALNHRTHYQYERAVAFGPQSVRLRPAPHCRTPIISYSLKITPAKHFLNWQQDPYGNHLARIVIPEKTDEFAVDVGLVADLTPINPFDFFLEPYAENYPFDYSPELAKDLEPYLALQPAGPLLQSFLNSVAIERRPSTSFLAGLNNSVRDRVGYVARINPGIQTCDETLERRTGSCRDSSWLLVQVLRRMGLAARFVSGYLIQLADESGIAEDSTDLHAWAEVYLPGAGWIGLDPTSGLLTGEGHIPLAATPEASYAAPITGTVEPAHVDFSYSMSVRRENAATDIALPFTEDQWARVERVAHQVDADLRAQDVRLTMGGEPTFVGIDEPDSAQWNGDAMGPLKRSRGVTLIRGIRDRMASGALLHFGQGKWYPGEALPRWALGCYWRADGVPVWQNQDLIAAEDREYGFGTTDASRFLEALTRRLEASSGNILPAFEDAFYSLWKERRFAELARLFEGGVTEPAGYLLPIRRRQFEGRLYWSSQLWFPRPERLLLMQGDSPIGYRVPLESLPWVAPDDIPYETGLPPGPTRRMDLFNKDPADDPLPAAPVKDEGPKLEIRPALSVEAREGRLHVFMPFTTSLPDYLDLLSAVEDTCAYLKQPVWIEGYTPPADRRIQSFTVVPDPGVIEVNLPPASNWDELQAINNVVFEEALQSRLTAEKFLPDGKHKATGGGNHIVIGGPTAEDSPLLRRPDLLRSMLAFWQNHPSLSYLFSGAFVGPTSQYPRVDEARMDALYELEMAFSQLPAAGCPPLLVDRLFRNLLVDSTGNTHRAEFCIDKLFPPQGSGLQLGLLELRAFEMAPHVRMGLAELLLIRALVSMFWKKPYEGRMVRWGTGLHDRFLLPHFVSQDFSEVLAILRQSGYGFEEQWYRSYTEFRFPKAGSIAVQGLQLELRQALEPWPVLGEASVSGSTSRTVDSSLERLQVKVSGWIESRYAVSCNGRRVPLHPTGKPGEAVAGVRFRAWQLPESLHPTIPVQSPLVFDIVDLWNEQSIGGCTYHVLRPDGDWYSTRPANAAEAESRRAERFQDSGHAPHAMIAPAEELNPVFPMTLDLRWPVLS